MTSDKREPLGSFTAVPKSMTRTVCLHAQHALQLGHVPVWQLLTAQAQLNQLQAGGCQSAYCLKPFTLMLSRQALVCRW